MDAWKNEGCYCTKQQLHNFLRVMGADEVEGELVVSGTVVSFLGAGQEYVIGADANYYVDGIAIPLAPAYRSATGRGAIKVY